MRAAGSTLRTVVSNCARSQGFWFLVRASIQPPGSLNEDAGAHQSHIAQAAQGHGDVKLLPDDIEALRDPSLPSSPETVQEGTPDEDALGAERQGLDDILSGSDPPIHEDLDAVADSGRDRRERHDGRNSAIQLTPAVVRDNQRLGAACHRPLGILWIQNALEDQLPAPAVLDTFNVIPAEGRVELLCCPRRQRAKVADALGVADDVAERPALCAQHPQAPARLGGEIDDVRNRHPRWGREAVLDVLMALTEDLKIHRHNERGAPC